MQHYCHDGWTHPLAQSEGIIFQWWGWCRRRRAHSSLVLLINKVAMSAQVEIRQLKQIEINAAKKKTKKQKLTLSMAKNSPFIKARMLMLRLGRVLRVLSESPWLLRTGRPRFTFVRDAGLMGGGAMSWRTALVGSSELTSGGWLQPRGAPDVAHMRSPSSTNTSASSSFPPFFAG